MSRSCWYVGFALAIGLVLIGADQPSQSSLQPEQTTGQNEIVVSLDRISAAINRPQETDESTKPCAKNEENRNSELCAQWKAADAASESAAASWCGVVIGILTLCAAVVAAIYAGFAANESKRSADIAAEDINLSRTTFISHNPPKLTIRNAYVEDIVADVPLSVNIDIFNEGICVALLNGAPNYRSKAFVWVANDRLPPKHVERSLKLGEHSEIDSTVTKIYAGDYFSWHFKGRVLSKDDVLNIKSKKTSLYIIGLIRYGNELTGNYPATHRTLFCWKYDAKSGYFLVEDVPGYNFQS